MCEKPAQVQHSRKECVYLVCVFTLSQCRMWFDKQSQVKNVVALAQYGHAVDLIPHLHYKPRSQFKHAQCTYVSRQAVNGHVSALNRCAIRGMCERERKRTSERARTHQRTHAHMKINLHIAVQTQRTVFVVSKNVSIFIWLWWMNDTIKN